LDWGRGTTGIVREAREGRRAVCEVRLERSMEVKGDSGEVGFWADQLGPVFGY
jgi:hypothetical protein